MKVAHIYNRRGMLFFQCCSQTVDGLWIATPPLYELPCTAPSEDIGDVIVRTLSASRIGIAHPNDWDELIMPLLRLADAKNISSFEGDASLCLVEEQDGELTIKPQRKGGVGRGYEGQPDREVVLKGDGSHEEIGSTVLAAFEECT